MTTFTQVHIQVVFSVKHRQPLLAKPWREDVFKYMNGILNNLNHKPIIVNGVSDHVHLLFGLNSSRSVADTVRELKSCSTKYIKEKGFLKTFAWQEGYGAFSYAKEDLPNVLNYIKNQEAHHAHFDFEKEYRKLLDDNGILYNEKYLF